MELILLEKNPNKTEMNCKINIAIKLCLLLGPPIRPKIIPPNIFPIKDAKIIVIEYDKNITCLSVTANIVCIGG